MVDVCKAMRVDFDESKPYVLFHSGIYSQWHKSSFQAPLVVGPDQNTFRTWSCCEQYMMAGKAILFGDTEILQQILATNNPRNHKEFGRQVRGFKRKIWNQQKFNIVCAGNYYKFRNESNLRDQLLQTGDRIMAEASPNDAIWGIGLGASDEAASDFRRWRGTNLLGQALMVARQRIRGELSQSEHPAQSADTTTAISTHDSLEAVKVLEAAILVAGSKLPTWPMSKIQKQLQQIEENQSEGAEDSRPRRRCVLLTTGALNPVHRGHAQMLESAKRHLESNEGFDVLGGFLSPSSDVYVSGKCNKKHLHANGSHRALMCESLLSSGPFDVSTWEIQHTKHWPDFPEVVDELVHQVSTAFPGKDVLVVYVCGADHAVYCSSLLRQNGVGVCVIKRAGSGKGKVFAGNSSSDSLSKLFYAKHITEGSTDFEQFSSTKVRSLLDRYWKEIASGNEENDYVPQLTVAVGKNVLDHIRKHRLYDPTFKLR